MARASGRHALATPPPFGLLVALALVAGVAGCLQLPALPPSPLVLACLVTGTWAWVRATPWRPAGALIAGVALCALHAGAALDAQLPPPFERADVVVQGRISGLPVHEPQRTSFVLRVDDVASVPAHLRGQRIRLGWYDDRNKPVDDRRAELVPGSRWRFTARLRAPRALRNPGTFDGERHALAHRIVAAGYVREVAHAQRTQAGRGVDAWRDAMSRRIDARAPAHSARFLQALAVGDTRRLDDTDWDTLRATGLTHLIAISGFHVGMVAGVVALAFAGLWRLLPWLGRVVPRPQAAAGAALAGAIGYAAVAGFGLPTVRTVLMIGVVVAARLWRRPLGVADALALAAIGVLVVDPLSVLAPGFWLSFAGVAWLVGCLPDAHGRNVLRTFLSAQWVATLGLLPLTVVLFGQASLAGPLANLLAIPWWSLVVIPLTLIGTAIEGVHAGAGEWAWTLAAACFDGSWRLFGRLAASDLAFFWLPEPRAFALPFALVAAVWRLLPRGLPGRPLALLLWLPLLWPDRRLPAHGEVEVVAFDVGQGLSVLVRTARHALLYDMGPAIPDGYDAGERAVVPALHALGVRRLDAAVVSHGDSDHAGGRAAVARRFPSSVTYAPAGSALDGTRTCRAGDDWSMDGVTFRFLHPPDHFPYLGNEASCVLRIASAHGVVLLTGDIGAVVERDLVRRHARAVRADVVFAGHHGSRHSSDPAFVAATHARHVVVSTGFGNRHGHPDPAVVERWEAAGARVVDTAGGGALRVRIGDHGVSVEARRDTHPRPWDAARRHARAAGLSYRSD